MTEPNFTYGIDGTRYKVQVWTGDYWITEFGTWDYYAAIDRYTYFEAHTEKPVRLISEGTKLERFVHGA